MNAIPTSQGAMSPEDVVDYLTYCCYRANRARMSATDLKTIFPDSGDAMETRYQSEIAIEKARTA